jgi:lipid-A-disaccharide synthase
MSRRSIFVAAGEASGDAHASTLLDALRRQGLDFESCGLGGESLQARGMRLIAHLRQGAVVGITEALYLLPSLLSTYRRLVEELRRNRPDLLILVDYPEMNLRLARQARAFGIPVCYYIVPQVWAWRPGRVKQLRDHVDLSLCLFAFEEPFLRERGVAAEFVGHPLAEQVSPEPRSEQRKSARLRLGLSQERTTVGVLPGSRPSELRHHLETFVEACTHILNDISDAQFVLALAPGLDHGLVQRVTRRAGGIVQVVLGSAAHVLAASDVVLTKSGTCTVEAALHQTPMVIGYRVNPFSYWLARRLVRCEHIGMANLLAGERAFPELIQDQLQPKSLAKEAVRLLRDPPIAEVYARIRASLGGAGSQDRAAQKICERFFSAPRQGP